MSANMIDVKPWLDAVPAGKSVVVMSGGLDSTIAARLVVEKLGAENVHALSFYYKQKQSIELELAAASCKKMGIKHTLVDISFLGDMVRGVSANIAGGEITMPNIHDILGDPAPVTEVPFRNSILLMISTAYAQVNGMSSVVTGLQAADQYSYWDTTPAFIDAMNGVLGQNRMHDIEIFAPWQGVNKSTEIQVLQALDGNTSLLDSTITCYNPVGNVSCGTCPSCSERIQNFMRAGVKDNIPYAINIPWSVTE